MIADILLFPIRVLLWLANLGLLVIVSAFMLCLAGIGVGFLFIVFGALFL